MRSLLQEGLGTVRTRTGDDLADRLETILREVGSRGVRINPQSRLHQYVKLLRSRGTEIIEQVSFAHHEADEIVTGVEHLARLPEVSGWASMFGHLQGGPLIGLPQHDRAREKQTEFLLGGLMRATGATVTFEEPDAKALVDDHTLSFAAKRTTSAANLRKNFRDGRNQLARAGGVGVLFLDVTPLVPQCGQAQVVPSIEYAVETFDAPLTQLVSVPVRPLLDWFDGSARPEMKTLAAV